MLNNQNRGDKLKRKISKFVGSNISSIESVFSKIPRTKLIFLGFLFITFIILYTSLTYQVIDYKFWKDIADNQQLRQDKTLVNRGTIYSNNTPKGVIGVSAELSDLAIDPVQDGSKEALKDFLIDVVYKHYCFKYIDDNCINGIGSFSQVNIYEIDPRDLNSETNLKNLIENEIENKLAQKYITKVLISTGVKEDMKKMVYDLNSEALYFVSDNLYLNLDNVTNKVSLIDDLNKITGLSKNVLETKFEKRETRYISIIKKISISLKDYIDSEVEKELELISIGRKPREESFIQYLVLEPHPSRFYPEQDIGPQIIGFVDNSGEGRYGIEGYFNNELKGQQGIKLGRKDIRGRPIGKLSREEQIEENGINMTLTIDRNIQKNVEELLEEGVKSTGANRGTVVVMDPRKGSVLSIANYPKFNPNEFGDVYEIERVLPQNDIFLKYRGFTMFVEDSESGSEHIIKGEIKFLREATDAEIINSAIPKYKYKNNLGPRAYSNDAISALYEPGSIFKSITVAVGIDSGEILPTDLYYDKGFAEVGQFKITNVSSNCNGTHSYINALNWSCNVGMINIAQKVGPAIFNEYIKQFGFGSKTNITLDNEVFSTIKPYEQWSKAQLFTTSYGRGITATAIQLAAAYSTLANGGIHYQPYIVSSIERPNGSIIENKPQELRRVIKEETSDKVTYMLVDGVNRGFAKVGAVEGYDIAGKTGTSGIPDGRGGYESGYATTMGSFAGYGPIYSTPSPDMPMFVVIVKLERPRTSEFGGATAGPIFGEIMKYLLEYSGIPKNR